MLRELKKLKKGTESRRELKRESKRIYRRSELGFFRVAFRAKAIVVCDVFKLGVLLFV